MSETIGALAGLRDIEAPLAASTGHADLAVAAIALVAACAAGAWLAWRRARTNRARAARALARLDTRLQRGETGARTAAYELAAVLRGAPPHDAGFRSALDLARYARNEPSRQAVAALVQDARASLRGPR